MCTNWHGVCPPCWHQGLPRRKWQILKWREICYTLKNFYSFQKAWHDFKFFNPAMSSQLRVILDIIRLWKKKLEIFGGPECARMWRICYLLWYLFKMQESSASPLRFLTTIAYSMPIRRPWSSITTNFITGFSSTKSFDDIFVVLNWFTKMTHFVICKNLRQVKTLQYYFLITIIDIMVY